MRDICGRAHIVLYDMHSELNHKIWLASTWISAYKGVIKELSGKGKGGGKNTKWAGYWVENKYSIFHRKAQNGLLFQTLDGWMIDIWMDNLVFLFLF